MGYFDSGGFGGGAADRQLDSRCQVKYKLVQLILTFQRRNCQDRSSSPVQCR
jgi:hypothetical protein